MLCYLGPSSDAYRLIVLGSSDLECKTVMVGVGFMRPQQEFDRDGGKPFTLLEAGWTVEGLMLISERR